MLRPSGLRLAVLLALASLSGVRAGGESKPVTFAGDVLPVFEQKCLGCHNQQMAQQGLDLSDAVKIFKGGNSGPAIEMGASGKSLLVSKLVSGAMPPGGPKLADEQIEVIRAWIDHGAAQEAEKLGLTLVTEADVLPILQARCVACHGKREQRGGLDLRTQTARLKGGGSGPALVPGKPDESLIIQKIELGAMPPVALQKKYAVRTPTEAELKTLRQWIAANCPPAPEIKEVPIKLSESDRNFWSFLPPTKPPVPEVQSRDLVRNPIDAFLLEKLLEKGLRYAPEAAPHELLRRAYLDLTGLPPTPEQARQYLEDQSPDRYERLIQRLLETQEYGERWGRHWLDVAGYNELESTSTVAPIRTHAWRYRDYVIRALNEDKPFDRFVTEQIAGDEMEPWIDRPVTPELVDRLSATGYLRTANDPTWEPEFAFLAERMDVLAEQVQIVGSGLMGLTVGCARCHDHKYDPVSQADFYAMSAILQSAYDPYDWKPPVDRELPTVTEEEKAGVEKLNAPVKEEIGKLKASLEQQAGPLRKQLLEERLEALPEGVRADLRKVLETAEDGRTELQRYLAKQFEDTLEISTGDLSERFETFKTASEPIREKIDELEEKLKPEPKVRALTDMGGEPSEAYLLQRGDAMSPGRPIRPNVPLVAAAHIDAYAPAKLDPGMDSSGRRLGLAQWLTQPDHPLVTRVLVNRIWMRHFGRGIVASVDNFGKMGDKPTHPELLDWLAVELVEGGWKLKRMHYLMMTSQAYRQSSRASEAALEKDADNTLFSRMPLRRMDADQIYDSTLLVAGRLDPERFGPASELETNKETGEITVKPTDKGYRRSIYILQQPLEPVSLLEAFDFPQMAPNCTMRSVSNVATQALQLMNSDRSWDLSRYLAGRVIDSAGADRKLQVGTLFQRVLTRPPTESEMQDALAAIETFEKHWLQKVKADRRETPSASTAAWLAVANLGHTLLNSAEFAFID